MEIGSERSNLCHDALGLGGRFLAYADALAIDGKTDRDFASVFIVPDRHRLLVWQHVSMLVAQDVDEPVGSGPFPSPWSLFAYGPWPLLIAPEHSPIAVHPMPHAYTQVLQFITDVLYDVAELNIERYIAAMTNGNEIDQTLAAAAERIRREAYAAGWRDAVATLNKAMVEFTESGGLPEGAMDLSGGSGGTGNASGLTTGSTPWYVFQAIKKRPGMTGAEIVSVVQEGGHRVSEGSIRTSLTRLEKRKLIVSRHKRWFSA